jgi:peptide/nickel transport system permease protein
MASVTTPVPPVHTPGPLQMIFRPIRLVTSSYAGRILLQSLFTIWAVTTFTFFLIRLMPGNPIQIRIDQLMNQNYTYEEARAVAAGLYDFDPDEPIIEQYVEYLGRLVQGDLGKSISTGGTPVLQTVLEFLPWTLFSVGSGLMISFMLGILIGTVMAYRRGSLFDNVMTGIASFTYGIPDYVIALLLIIVVGVQWKWFQVGEMRGGSDPNIPAGLTPQYLISVLQHAILPVGTYIISTLGSWILAMKSSTISTLGEDYITVAKARGLSERRILTAYVGRNAMLPLVTRLAISLGFVVGGSVLVEEFFQYPGLGRRLLRAIFERDYTTMQGLFLFISMAVVASNALSDLLLGWLDPRVRLGKGGDSK